ncbi:sensor histidine kinase [Roseivirga sp. E12]|uniref:sensor histidine kinase n=1 Tax=Roseivirga sp. E12 TaxID=2819237 RepID=UPI001ABC9D6D|nr:histidine kinase [Roseivirga sp. E12]MBO3697361.1 histidine kinase [Roseivirga sp. E12]
MSVQDLQQQLNSEAIAIQERQLEFVTILILIPVLLLFVFGFFFYYRLKRESQIREKELELRYAKIEMEMRALRAQVNPHFIFNCLNSIQYAIHQKNNELAERYLVKFSRLIRQVLEHSYSAYISLQEDLEVMNLYVELEQMRLTNQFDYRVTIDEEIDLDNLSIPPLLIQPLVENSIWHGLNNRKEEGGRLEINYKISKKRLVCEIVDNGRKGSLNLTNKGKSFGLSLVRERMKLHMGMGNEPRFEMNELTDQLGAYSGMKVVLDIPFELS